VGIDRIKELAGKIRRRIKDDIGINALEVPAGRERAFLAPLAIGKMPDIGKKTEHTLRGLGIDTIGNEVLSKSV